MESRWPTAAEAIRRADEMVGVVINNEKEFVWERGNKQTSVEISLDDIPENCKERYDGYCHAGEETLGKDVVGPYGLHARSGAVLCESGTSGTGRYAKRGWSLLRDMMTSEIRSCWMQAERKRISTVRRTVWHCLSRQATGLCHGLTQTSSKYQKTQKIDRKFKTVFSRERNTEAQKK